MACRAIHFLVFLLALAMAVPFKHVPNAIATRDPIKDPVTIIWNPRTFNHSACGMPSSVTSTPYLPKASWSECAALASDLGKSVGGTFTIDNPHHGLPFMPIVQYRSCSLAILTKGLEQRDGLTVILGNDDVEHMLKGALNEGSTGSEIAAHGTIQCDTTLYNVTGDPGDYHNPGGPQLGLTFAIFDAEGYPGNMPPAHTE